MKEDDERQERLEELRKQMATSQEWLDARRPNGPTRKMSSTACKP